MEPIETRPLPDPHKIFMTPGVRSMKGNGFKSKEEDYLFEKALKENLIEEYKKQPDTCFDGGNDKYFFVMHFRGVKLFVASNEIGGLTIMLPEEY